MFTHSNTSKMSRDDHKWDDTELILTDTIPHNVTFNHDGDMSKLDDSQMPHPPVVPKILNRNLSQKQ